MTTDVIGSKVTYLRPPKEAGPRHHQDRDALDDIGRFVWRYRYQLIPFYVMIILGSTAMILGRSGRMSPYWWTLPIVGVALAGIVYGSGHDFKIGERRPSYRFPATFRVARPAGKRYAAALLIISSLWYADTVRHGGTTYHDWMILFVGTCLGASGWWNTYRVRGSVPVRIYDDVPAEARHAALDKAREIVADWTAFCSAAGLGNGTGLRGIAFDQWSVTISIEMRMGDTLRRLNRAESLAKIESAYRGRRSGVDYRSHGIYGSCREGAARIENAATGMAHLAVLRIMIRDPHEEPIMPPELGLSDFDEITVGLFETGEKITFMLVNTIIAGMTDAGKSGVMNVVIRALARMRKVAIVGVDLKPGAPEFSPWRDVMHTLATTPVEALEVFERLIMGLTWRGEEMTRRGWKNWRPTVDHPFIVVLVDETQEIMTAKIDGKRVDLKTPMDRIAAMIRAYGGCLIVATQYPIGPNLTATTKQNATQRVGLRTGDDMADRVIFGNDATRTQYTPSKILPGRNGSLLIRNARHRKPLLGRAFYVAEESITDEVEETRGFRTMIDTDTWPMIEGEINFLDPVEPGVSLIKVEDDETTEIIDAVIVEGPAERILEAIGTAGDQGARPVDLARDLGLSKATIFRYLGQLSESGQIATKGRGRYVRI